jgi:hypothetical protein
VSIPNIGKVEFTVTYTQENEKILTTVLGNWTLTEPAWKNNATEFAEMIICFWGTNSKTQKDCLLFSTRENPQTGRGRVNYEMGQNMSWPAEKPDGTQRLAE